MFELQEVRRVSYLAGNPAPETRGTSRCVSARPVAGTARAYGGTGRLEQSALPTGCRSTRADWREGERDCSPGDVHEGRHIRPASGPRCQGEVPASFQHELRNYSPSQPVSKCLATDVDRSIRSILCQTSLLVVGPASLWAVTRVGAQPETGAEGASAPGQRSVRG